ncbi:MAG: YIP1 family protein [Pseudomonadota bacterium]
MSAETKQGGGLLVAAARFFISPRQSVEAVIARRPSEGTLLAIAMFVSLLLLIRQSLAVSASDAFVENRVEVLTGHIVSALFFVPLGLYIFASFGTMIARLFRGDGSWYEGRVALFWSSFIAAPVLTAIAVLEFLVPNIGHTLMVLLDSAAFILILWTVAQAFAGAFAFTRPWLVFIVTCSPALLAYVSYGVLVML